MPDERLQDLLGLHSAGHENDFLPIALGIPMDDAPDDAPAFSFSSLSREAALQCSFEAELGIAWSDAWSTSANVQLQT